MSMISTASRRFARDRRGDVQELEAVLGKEALVRIDVAVREVADRLVHDDLAVLGASFLMAWIRGPCTERRCV